MPTRSSHRLSLRPRGTAFWLLVDDGTPVPTLFTSGYEHVVSVWCMSTPPQFAGRGYGRAILAHGFGEAHADGATVGLLGATPVGKPLYDATGWSTLEEWRLFVNATSVQFTG